MIGNKTPNRQAGDVWSGVFLCSVIFVQLFTFQHLPGVFGNGMFLKEERYCTSTIIIYKSSD